jgi:hypothetical protein
LESEHYLKRDILKVIHLVDTDGTYIEESMIFENETLDSHIYIPDRGIETHAVDNIIRRNDKKSLLMNILSSTNKIYGCKYKMYYFSCNLEHVLHNKCNVSVELKNDLADEFALTYYENPVEFLDFIRDEKIAVQGNYNETWEYIKEDLNSVNRNCNSIYFLIITELC